MENIPYQQIAKYLAGESTEVEKKEIELWIEQHPTEMAEMTAIWKKTNADHSFSNIESALKNVNARLDKLETIEIIKTAEKVEVEPKSKRRTLLYTLGIAASIAVLFTIMHVTNLFNVEDEPISNCGCEVFQTGPNEVKEIILPDGSQIILNGSSSIEYASNFDGDKREVGLHGEAFFDIAKEPNRPFIIHTDNTETRVLGTSFGIRAMEYGGDVIVTVATGVVSFTSEKTKSEVKLNKGEQASYISKSEKIEKSEISDPNYLAWQTKILTFDDTPLSEVAMLIEEVYHIPVSVDPTISEMHLTARFEKLNIDELLQIVSLSLDIDAQKIDKGIFFKNK